MPYNPQNIPIDYRSVGAAGALGSTIGAGVAMAPTARYMTEDIFGEPTEEEKLRGITSSLSDRDLAELNALLEENSGMTI